MPRKRIINKDLPQRVYFKHGAYYYVTAPPESKWIRLGKTKQEMYLKLAKFNTTDTPCYTIENLWNRYKDEVVIHKSVSTQDSNHKEIKNLLKVFGKMHPESVKPQHVAEYLDTRGMTAPSSSNKEIALLSHMYTKAVRWGISDRNPCLRVERNKAKARERYVEDWEFFEFKKVCCVFMNCYIDLKYLTGLRKTDMLLLTLENITDKGLFVRPSKTKNSVGEPRLYEWTDDLLAVIDRVKALPRPVISSYLFCTKSGEPYIDDRLKTAKFGYIWGKTMKKALSETELLERFQERDLRAKSGTDADNQGQDATDLLGHGDRRMTKRYLRSKQAKRVQPLHLTEEFKNKSEENEE